MSDYSDLIFLTAAMVVFGMLTINTARSFQMTSDTMIRSDLEYRAIAFAQDEIDAIRWIEDETLLQSTSTNYIFNPETIQKTVHYGDEEQYSETFTITRESIPITDDSNGNNRYKVVVTAESEALTPKISGTLEFIKTFEN